MNDNKKGLDFVHMDISRLYLSILIPTLMGMVSAILVIITDGFFLGHYVGSDALAAVNIVSPIFSIATGIGLMFGIGCSVLCASYLAQNKIRLFNINFTQTVLISIIFMTICSILLSMYNVSVSRLLGSSDRLLSAASSYVKILSCTLPFFILENMGIFMIRLDGSPRFAMLCTLFSALYNMVGDYLFVAHFGYGIAGAAFATSSSFVIGAVMVIIYVLFWSKDLRFTKMKVTVKNICFALKNERLVCRYGFSGMVSQISIAVLAIVGNYVFLYYLHEEGVAAFSVVCFYLPVLFMINNAIAQSAQPIISFNRELKQSHRVREAFELSIKGALIVGILATALMSLAAPQMVSVFLDSSQAAYQIAVEGMPYFASGYIFFGLNAVYLGYLQSIQQSKLSNNITWARGYILLIIFFYILPIVMGTKGIWLSMPAAEIVTTVSIVLMYLFRMRTKVQRINTIRTIRK